MRLREKKEEKKVKKEKKPKTEKDDENLLPLAETPQVDSDDAYEIRRKLKSIVDEVSQRGERRNAFLNLAWTQPAANTDMAKDISKTVA